LACCRSATHLCGLRIDWWPVSKRLLIFLALAVASVVYAVGFREVDLPRSLNELRPFIYYGASIVVAMALTRPRRTHDAADWTVVCSPTTSAPRSSLRSSQVPGTFCFRYG